MHTVKIDVETTIYGDSYGEREIRGQLLVKGGGLFRSARGCPQGDTVLVQEGGKGFSLCGSSGWEYPVETRSF
ncbi:MAG: hypothetical protein PHY29_00415 [Syntrophales bacterium]|nr:hypothetical protein [Syntrophales bacterium]